MKKIKIKINIYKVIGTLALFYMFFIVGKISYQNYTINQRINSLKSEVVSLEKDNKELRDNIEYYKTDAYKEKVARQRLGLKMPGESVVVIVPEEEGEEEKNEVKRDSNPQKWWNFFFSKNEV